MFTIRASNEIDEYRQCLQFQFHYYATLLTYAKIKYTKMYLIITVMYVKKITSFCQVLKKMHAKENWFFFLPHGVYCKLSSLINWLTGGRLLW